MVETHTIDLEKNCRILKQFLNNQRKIKLHTGGFKIRYEHSSSLKIVDSAMDILQLTLNQVIN